jgi:cytochrome o ubiquinol oxidase operon protein cyoD
MTNDTRAVNVFVRYVIGFASSIILTIVAFASVMYHLFSMQIVIAVIVGLAVVQLFVQLFFFLHIGEEYRPRWRLMFLGFAALVVFIVVAGSLWIMANLNYNMMPGNMDIDTYMRNNEGL